MTKYKIEERWEIKEIIKKLKDHLYPIKKINMIKKIELNQNAQLTSPEDSQRKPAMLAKLAWARFQNGDVDDAASLAPIYLHTAAPIES